MGKFCKAYYLKDFRKFSKWSEERNNLSQEKRESDSQVDEISKEFTDEDFLFLQENYVVTDGIFQDENVVFNNVTPEWKDFCSNTLLFEIPVY